MFSLYIIYLYAYFDRNDKSNRWRLSLMLTRARKLNFLDGWASWRTQRRKLYMPVKNGMCVSTCLCRLHLAHLHLGLGFCLAHSMDKPKASFNSLKKTSDESATFVEQLWSSMVKIKEGGRTQLSVLKVHFQVLESNLLFSCYLVFCLYPVMFTSFHCVLIRVHSTWGWCVRLQKSNKDREYVQWSKTNTPMNELQVECEKSTSLSIPHFFLHDLSKIQIT
jgi:hypothetical protein